MRIAIEMVCLKRQLLSFALALGMVCSTSAAAQITVWGVTDCGLWLDARKHKRAVALEHYLVGLVSGLAFGSQTEIWNARGDAVTDKQLFYWMDGFCERNPLTNVLQGALEFKKERIQN